MPASGGEDPYAWEREVLKLAAVVHNDSEFTEAEQDRPAPLRPHVPLLQVALGSATYRFAQTRRPRGSRSPAGRTLRRGRDA